MLKCSQSWLILSLTTNIVSSIPPTPHSNHTKHWPNSFSRWWSLGFCLKFLSGQKLGFFRKRRIIGSGLRSLTGMDANKFTPSKPGWTKKAPKLAALHSQGFTFACLANKLVNTTTRTTFRQVGREGKSDKLVSRDISDNFENWFHPTELNLNNPLLLAAKD